MLTMFKSYLTRIVKPSVTIIMYLVQYLYDNSYHTGELCNKDIFFLFCYHTNKTYMCVCTELVCMTTPHPSMRHHLWDIVSQTILLCKPWPKKHHSAASGIGLCVHVFTVESRHASSGNIKGATGSLMGTARQLKATQLG